MRLFIESIQHFLDTGKPFIFTLGMVTAFAIIGFFEAIEYQPIHEPSIPAWVWVLLFIISIAMAGKIMWDTE